MVHKLQNNSTLNHLKKKNEMLLLTRTKSLVHKERTKMAKSTIHMHCRGETDGAGSIVRGARVISTVSSHH